MDSEHQPLASSTTELYSQEVPPSGDSAFGHDSMDVTGSVSRCDRRPWYNPPKRYIIAFMAFLGFANIYSLRVNLSVAIVAMTTNKTSVINGTRTVVSLAEFDWSNNLKGEVLASFFYGYILSQIPGGFLANRLGGKYVFGIGIMATAVLTFFIPALTSASPYLLIGCRVFQGLFEGVTYPAIHAIWARWAPPAERTKLATFAFSGSYFGTVLSLVISGSLAMGPAGWKAIFYLSGCLAVIWFLLWCILVTEGPQNHPGISSQELEYIEGSIGFTSEQTKKESLPWLSMIKSAPVWAIVVAHFVENWGFYTWLTELPTFMTHVLKFHVNEGSFLSALPYLVMGIVVMFSGQFADVLRSSFGMPTVAVRKIFTCSAFAIQAIFMIAAGYVDSKAGAVVCLTIAVGFGGFAWAGFSVNHLDIAPQFASILMGLSNTVATLPGILSPLLTGVVVTHQESSSDWQLVFYLTACIYLMGAIIYGIFASGDTQPWARIQSSFYADITGLESK